MSTPDEVKERIRKVAGGAGFKTGQLRDSGTLVLRGPEVRPGSRAGTIEVTCVRFEEDGVIVFLIAPVVRGLTAQSEGLLGGVMNVLNGLNEQALFGRWVLDEETGRVDLRHELVGNELDSRAIELVLEAMWRGANDLEPFLRTTLMDDLGSNDDPDSDEDEIDWD